MPPRERTADPSLRLETDVLIFDHITYDTTKALLRYANDQQNISRGIKRRHDGGDARAEAPVGPCGIENTQVPTGLENRLRMVDSFHQVFRAQHISPPQDPSPIPSTLAFRLSLLRLTALFTLRHTPNASSPSKPALAELRLQNQLRASQWCSNVGEGEVVFPEEVLRLYQTFQGREGASAIGGGAVDSKGDEDAVITDGDAAGDPYQRQASLANQDGGDEAQGQDDAEVRDDGSLEGNAREQPHLLDLLPLFVRLTYGRSKDDEDWRTTPAWLKLAADMMLQAVLEEFLDHGNGGVGPLIEAFAWGMEGMLGSEDAEGEDDYTRDLARREGQACQYADLVFKLERDSRTERRQSHGGSAWSRMRADYLMKILPQAGPVAEPLGSAQLQEAREDRIQGHLENVRSRHPPHIFDATMMSFLSDMAGSQDMPLLSQLEGRNGDIILDHERMDTQQSLTLKRLLRDA